VSEPEKERDPDADAESIHEGEGYCQMMRVVIAGRGPVVQTKGGQCGCVATGLVGILNEDVLASDCVVMENEAVEVWVPGCDRCRATYATQRAVQGCSITGCMNLHTCVVDGVKKCMWCAAKKKGPRPGQDSPPKTLQKDIPKKKKPVEVETDEDEQDHTADQEPEVRMFEVRIRLPHGEVPESHTGPGGQTYNYVRFLGEEAERPDNVLGKDEVGRRWIKIPSLMGDGQKRPGVVVSVAEQMCPLDESPKARRARLAGL